MAGNRAYRLCFFSGTRITGQTVIRCHSDGAARDFASQVRLVTSVEVWNRSRKVCRIGADRSDRAERAEGEDTAPKKAQTAKQHVRASRHLLSEFRMSNDHLIAESRTAIEDSRRLLERPFVSCFR